MQHFAKKAIRESVLYKTNWPKAKAAHGIKASEFLHELYLALNSERGNIREDVLTVSLISHAIVWAETPQGSRWWSSIDLAKTRRGTSHKTPASRKKRELRVLLEL